MEFSEGFDSILFWSSLETPLYFNLPMDAQELLAKYSQGQRDFIGLDLGECQLIGASLADINLRGAQLNVANLSSADLSRADLSQAQLNVSRLTGGNLSQANLSGCKLNVANLIRARLVDANLATASLIRAEMLRANLTNAHAVAIDLSEADLREAQCRQANFNIANLSRADLRGSSWIGASLEQAILNNCNGDRANFQGANLAGAELRHSVLTQADLSGAVLRDANLRWANLSGANLSGADLTNAKLSGAKLVGTCFEGANLSNALLVHADLHNANLMNTTWVNSDASGANLSGVKLFGALRYNLTLQEAECQWVDLSPNGDQHRVQHFATPKEMVVFFSRALSQVKLEVNAQLTPAGMKALSEALCWLGEVAPSLAIAPAIDIIRRHTTLTYTAADDRQLLALAYGAVLPFYQGSTARQGLLNLAVALKGVVGTASLGSKLGPTMATMLQTLAKVHQKLALQEQTSPPNREHPFLQASLRLTLVNSSNYHLTVFQGAGQGSPQDETWTTEISPPTGYTEGLPPMSALLAFAQGCHLC
jgi:uncharacterized protein YjbI with pentapeptide repeats